MFIITFTDKQTGLKEYYSEKKSKTNISKALSTQFNDATIFETQQQAYELWKLYSSKKRIATEALTATYYITINEVKIVPLRNLI